MRLFTGFPIPPPVVANLERLLEHLRPTAQLKWSPAYNLHVTTKFIGEWPEERLEELQGALGQLTERAPLPLDIRGLGWFPNPHHPRVFFAAVQAPPALAELARDTDARLQALGVPAETKPFAPHLTLARVRTPVPLTGLKEAIAALASVEFGQFEADRFHLYQSEPGPAGSIYTSLATFPLAPRA